MLHQSAIAGKIGPWTTLRSAVQLFTPNDTSVCCCFAHNSCSRGSTGGPGHSARLWVLPWLQWWQLCAVRKMEVARRGRWPISGTTKWLWQQRDWRCLISTALRPTWVCWCLVRVSLLIVLPLCRLNPHFCKSWCMSVFSVVSSSVHGSCTRGATNPAVLAQAPLQRAALISGHRGPEEARARRLLSPQPQGGATTTAAQVQKQIQASRERVSFLPAAWGQEGPTERPA